MSLPALPLFMAVADRPVMLLGDGPAADAKARLLGRAGAVIVGEADVTARLAIVALEGEAAIAAAARLRARGLLVNVVDRPELCDFTLPAIVDRAPVLVAIGTAGVSAGLAAALRQRLEALLPAGLGALATALGAARGALRARFPDAVARRRAIARLLSDGGPLDPLREHADPAAALGEADGPTGPARVTARLASPDPDELTLRTVRLLAQADRVVHAPDMPAAILDRARADAERLTAPATLTDAPGLTLVLEWAR